MIKFEILRRRSASDPPYTATVSYDRDADTTVAEALTYINAEILTDDPVAWEHSCRQKKCGACAMLINGVPKLACDAWLRDYPEGVIRLAPLRKFPPVRDLMVDRSVMFENLKMLGAWLTENADGDTEGTAYDASRCLQCGCCLEVCPNFYAGGKFSGAAALAPASRLISEAQGADRKRLYGAYNERFYRGCGKSLSCRNICPAGIDTERLLVSSNAAAVWKRLFRRGKKK